MLTDPASGVKFSFCGVKAVISGALEAADAFLPATAIGTGAATSYHKQVMVMPDSEDDMKGSTECGVMTSLEPAFSGCCKRSICLWPAKSDSGHSFYEPRRLCRIEAEPRTAGQPADTGHARGHSTVL